jgi:hypothetical protein
MRRCFKKQRVPLLFGGAQRRPLRLSIAADPHQRPIFDKLYPAVMNPEIPSAGLSSAASRDRNTKRLRTSLLAAIIIGALVWYTRWPTLKPGLLLLLVGQLGVALILLWRNRTIAMSRLHTSEEVFLRRLRIFDNCQRTLGFAVLGYGFWTATHNLWLALALGVLYPAVAALGVFTGGNRATRTLK